MLSPTRGQIPTRYSPVRHSHPAETRIPFDLHVLSMPPAFNLSQDQTLQFKPSSADSSTRSASRPTRYLNPTDTSGSTKAFPKLFWASGQLAPDAFSPYSRPIRASTHTNYSANLSKTLANPFVRRGAHSTRHFCFRKLSLEFRFANPLLRLTIPCFPESVRQRFRLARRAF